MKEKLKFIVLPVICLIVVGVTFYMIFDIKNKAEEMSYNTENIIEEDELKNNETTEENTVKNTEAPDDGSPVSSSEEGTTNKKQQAIELVKQEWGEDESVSFRCDTVTSDGEYIIEVITKASATVRNRFRVNLENKTVEIYY